MLKTHSPTAAAMLPACNGECSSPESRPNDGYNESRASSGYYEMRTLQTAEADRHSTATWNVLDRMVMEGSSGLGSSAMSSFWDYYGNEEHEDVFSYHHIRIAGHGGMNDVKMLMYNMQYLYAAFRIICLVTNCYVIAMMDIPAATFTWTHEDNSPDDHRDRFLVTAYLACIPADCDGVAMRERIHRLLPIFELSYMLWNIGMVVVCAIIAAFAPYLASCFGVKADLLRWHYVVRCFWHYIMELRAYSALKLVYYVTPTVISTHAYMLFVQAMETRRTANDCFRTLGLVLFFSLSRLICLIVGFDSFLVKFRLTARYVERHEMTMECILVAGSFLFQVLGAVKINTFVRERLFIFMFGGKGGDLNTDETILADVWNALLARKIYQLFGLIQGTIVMLGFDDYDFQMLVLEDDEAEARSRLANMQANTQLCNEFHEDATSQDAI